jgi:DNA topoisomerase-1
MDYQFTAQVEDWLDDVSRGERDWVKALRDFYDPFALALASAPPKMAAFKGTYQGSPVSPTGAEAGEEESIQEKASPRKRTRRSSSGSRRSPAHAIASKKQVAVDPNAPICPKCGSPMIKRNGPRGEFWGCATFPKCKGTRNL